MYASAKVQRKEHKRALSSLAFVFVLGFVVKNQLDGQQWATWWWVCVAGLVVFLPTIFVAAGYWSPARTRNVALQQAQN